MRGEEVKERMNLLQQEKMRQEHLDEVRRDTVRKIDFLNHKSVIEHHEVYQLIREFFKEFLEKRYEFTIKELRAELRKVYISNQTRKLIDTILTELEASEYATVHYRREDLIKLLRTFQEIVEQLVRTHVSKKSLLERIKSFLFKDPDPLTIIAELPVIEGNDAARVKVYTLIERCYIALDSHNMPRAKATYQVLLKEYEQLDDDRKAEHFPIIHQTYTDIMNRAQMLKK